MNPRFDKWVVTYVMLLEAHVGDAAVDRLRRAATTIVGPENTPTVWPESEYSEM